MRAVTAAASPRAAKTGRGARVSRARNRAKPPPVAQGSISTAPTSKSPRKAGTAPGGNCATAPISIGTPPTSMTRVIGTPSRSTLSISTVSAAPRHEPRTRPRPAADRGAAHDHGGDHDELGALAVLRGDALVLRDVHQPRERRRERRDHIGADARAGRRDAGVTRRLLIAADGGRLIAGARLAERDGAEERDQGKDRGSGC